MSQDLITQEVETWEKILSEVTDPELPFITIKDLGILRRVKIIESKKGKGGKVLEVVITPTFSGCPAMFEIRKRIEFALNKLKDMPYLIRTEISPPWTSGDISEEGKQLLIEHGIAVADRGISCPRCGSGNTIMISEFGSTACKGLARCQDCQEPFEVFKSIHRRKE